MNLSTNTISHIENVVAAKPAGSQLPAPPTVSGGRCAVLVFADVPALDLARRKWPQSFQALLQTQQPDAEWSGGAAIHLFTTAGLALPALLSKVTVHAQQGANFAERLENAVEELAQSGYDRVVIVGRDCPDLAAQDITHALQLLDDHTLALGPDHRGGCYLIALHLTDREKLNGICWQRNTDCAELTWRFGITNTALLSVKLDLDNLSDVRLLACSTSRWQQLAAALLRTLVASVIRFLPQTFPASQQRLRIFWQLPPPAISPFAMTH